MLWNKLTGNPAFFSLEARIFHSVCIIAMLALAINVPFNYFLELSEPALLMSVVLLVVALCYYLSRFSQQLTVGIAIFQAMNLVMLVTNYYYNSGANGPSLMIFVLSLVVSVAIIPQRQYVYWLPLNIVTILGLLIYEKGHPDWIPITYNDRDSRFTDLVYTYIVVASIILFVIIYIRNAYQREREATLDNNQQLKLSNDTKNKLLSIMAHDLKDPLASIQGFLELLTEYQLDDAEKLSIEKELLTRTQTASQMLSNILFWTKNQMNGVQTNLHSIKVRHVLANTIQILKGMAKEKGIHFECRFEENLCIMADADMLQLIIRNLGMNAIKFTYPGGTVSISAEVMHDFCTIAVADNGIGIPEDQQAKVFGLADQSTYGTGNEKGAGLGLVLCRNFTALQGGKLWLTSKVDAGTTFFVSFKSCTSLKENNVLEVVSN